MENQNESTFIDNLKERKSEKFKVEPVFHDGKFELETLNYLKKQKYLDFLKIKIYLKIKFVDNLPFGYILKNELDQVVGFLGTIFCNRTYNGNILTFCNLHTWIVEKSYRLNSYLLLLQLMEKKCAITTFTPIKTLVGLYKKFGFKELQMKHKVVFFFNLLNFFKTQRFKIETDNLFIKQNLKKEDLKIYEDNYHLSCLKFIIVDKFNSSNNIFIVAMKNKKKNFSIFDIIYTSNKNFFKDHNSEILSTITKKYKTLFFGQYFFDAREIFIPQKKIFSKESKQSICVKNLPDRFSLDTLYSELVY